MTKNDLITVTISAYNHERYVQETLKSVIEQTYQNIELIIVNDGSTDGTHQQIEAMIPRCRERFARVEYLNRENQGFVRSLNYCLSLAQGKYIYVIASDDIAEKSALEVLHRFLSSHLDYGLVVGDNAIIDNAGTICYWGPKQVTVYDKQEARSLTHAEHLQKNRPDIDFHTPAFGTYTSLLTGNYIPNGYLIRKSIIDIFGGYSEEAPFDDWYLMLQLSKYSKLKFINKNLFRYRWHATNAIKQRDKMERDFKTTLRMETLYAREHGFEAFIPKTVTLKISGIKLFYYTKTPQKTALRIFGITLYKRKPSTLHTAHYPSKTS